MAEPGTGASSRDASPNLASITLFNTSKDRLLCIHLIESMIDIA